MILTEEEAKNKWCPYQGTGEAARSANSVVYRCIASDCMAWRWSTPEEVKGNTEYMNEMRTKGATFKPECHMIGDAVVVKEDRLFFYKGFCGLAVNPYVK